MDEATTATTEKPMIITVGNVIKYTDLIGYENSDFGTAKELLVDKKIEMPKEIKTHLEKKITKTNIFTLWENAYVSVLTEQKKKQKKERHKVLLMIEKS